MNKDEVIPPSPPVKLSRSRKSKLGLRNSKKKEILSNRARSLQQQKANISIEPIVKIDRVPSEKSSQESSHDVQIRNVNIYLGLDCELAEEKSHIQTILNDFDILGQPKLIEKCNNFDLLSQSQNFPVSETLSHTHGLVSVKNLISSQNVTSPESVEDLRSHAKPSSLHPLVEREARDVSLENIQFSEWPNLSKSSIGDCNEDAHFQNQSSEFTGCTVISLKNRTTTQNDGDIQAESFVDSILNDFNDDTSDDENARTPPVVLIRRPNRRTYHRTHVAQVKTLTFDDANETKDEPIDDVLDIENTQDIDLNGSRRILENLTQLNTFFTQSHSYELDFSIDLSHNTTTLNEEFKEFIDDSDDFVSTKDNDNDFEAIIDTPNNANRSSENKRRSKDNMKPHRLFEDCADEIVDMPNDASHHKPTMQLLDDGGDEVFANITTPKVEVRCRDKNSSVSTPFSSIKGRIGDKMHSTPSTSKQSISMEQRIPKRLQFGAEFGCPEKNPELFSMSSFKPSSMKMGGFTTARGTSIKMSAAQLKRTANLFADIDEKYGQIDANLEDMPNVKRFKRSSESFKHVSSEQKTVQKADSIISHRVEFDQSNTNATNSTYGGFRAMAPKSIQKAMDIFGDDFDLGRQTLGFQSSNVAGPSTPVGFSKANGSKIKISAKHIEKYAETFKEISRNIRDEFENKDEFNVAENNLTCKTPLRKIDHQKMFTTSTPNPSSVSGFNACPPITPILNNDASAFVEHLNGEPIADLIDGVFDTSTQNVDWETARKQDTSANLNETITNDFQPLNDSVTEEEFDVLKIDDEIKCDRERAFIKQQVQCLNKSHPIRQHLSSLYLQKCIDSKKLHELDTPKKYKYEDLVQLGVQSNVIGLTVDNVLQFKFDMWKFYPENMCRENVDGIVLQDEMCLIMDGNSRVGVKELTNAFLSCPSVDPKLVPDHWINNALKWIMLKLASYERSYPREFAGHGLTPENVLVQLKYRYGREIDEVKRSAIRKIVERDDTAAKRMVLFVSRIIDNNQSCSLELCDGWYSIRTNVLDTVLLHAVKTGKIAIGTKLMIQGAEVMGFEEACTPLEMPTSVVLKISANSTRRAKWYTKLGYYKEPWPFAISFNSVNENGGMITRTRAYIVRVYPMIYAIKQECDDEQKTVFRSTKMENRQNQQDDKKHFELFEKFYNEASTVVENEYETSRKATKRSKKKICDIDDGEELWNFMENSNDSVELDLSSDQRRLLEDYQSKRLEEKENKISSIIRDKMGSVMNGTKSRPLKKVRLIDMSDPCATKTAILSIWNADESYDTLCEKTFVDLRYVTASGRRLKDIQLTANSFTKMKQIRMAPSSLLKTFDRKLISLAEIYVPQFQPHFNELDTFGVVVKVEEVVSNYPFQLVYIADAQKNMLCIKFWKNIRYYAYDDIVQVNRFLAISQLDWRPIENADRISRNSIPHAFVNELSTITENPKPAERSLALASLRDQIDQIDFTGYIEDCCEKIRECTQGNKENSVSNISSKTLNTSLNQTRAATSPGYNSSVLMEKITRLQNYGTPPPHRVSYICTKRTPGSVRKPFKVPSRIE